MSQTASIILESPAPLHETRTAPTTTPRTPGLPLLIFICLAGATVLAMAFGIGVRMGILP